MDMQLQDRNRAPRAVRAKAVDGRSRARAAGQRVLIIEDDDLLADLLAIYVSDLGYTNVLRASTESGAVAATEEYAPDLILADVRLGEGGDGISAVRQANKKTGTALVYVTAHPQLTSGESKAVTLPKADLTGDRLAQAIEAAMLIRFLQ
ncbi:response regulator [Caulobacter segnis]|uniref:response regulator n=1 Tax=Caulobacter segnis TaxID=88688 RepID=UPI0024106DF2|nr:response regulator [Caulobacter segnis]MDG2523562.1 response regulator [Caulobacter segnis]